MFENTVYLDGNNGDFDDLQYEFPWFTSTSVVFLAGVHEVILDLPPEALHFCHVLQTLVVLVLPRRGVIGLTHIIQVTGLLHI